MDTDLMNEQPTKKERWKAMKKQIKEEKKEAKRARKAALHERYADAPFLTRFWKFHKRLILSFAGLICIAAIAIVTYTLLYMGTNEYFEELVKQSRQPVDYEKIYAQSPIDEEGLQKIKALGTNNASDTWTFCVYIIGSNLEDNHENDLSELTKILTREARKQNQEEVIENTITRFNRYQKELGENGLEFPRYLYKPTRPIASSEYVTEEVIVTDMKGSASDDIEEMLSDIWPENIQIVIQTGGATHWTNALVNPNRTQRFLYHNGVFNEVANLPLQDSTDPATLTDFMKYCRDDYSADHMALILWDHGGGAFGFGMDSIFDSGSMSNREIREALKSFCKYDPKDPYWDIIGFDACLMGSMEVAHELYGYGKYLAGSEEIEPGFGWDYGVWLTELAQNPTMNAADICRSIADSYMDYYMRQNVNSSKVFGDSNVTFSVIDIAEAEATYDAYGRMNEKLLALISKDHSALQNITRSASLATRYAKDVYDIYNTIDLGMYLDFLSYYYPEEVDECRQSLRSTVLYHRQNGILEDSEGLSVYFPVELGNATSLQYCMRYFYEISEQESTNALYYYKASGCLNEEHKKYLQSKGIAVPVTLDTSIFKKYEQIIPEIDDDFCLTVNIEKELEELISNCYLEFEEYDTEREVVTYYGTDGCCEIDENGNIVASFYGDWFAIDGKFIQADFISSNGQYDTYRSHILYNGEDSYMTFTYDVDSKLVSINSINPISDEEAIETAAASKRSTQMNPGDKIEPIFVEQNLITNEEYDVYGDTIKFKENTVIELKPLPNATYLGSAVIVDQRGDRYYSGVASYTLSNGKIKDAVIDPRFVGYE